MKLSFAARFTILNELIPPKVGSVRETLLCSGIRNELGLTYSEKTATGFDEATGRFNVAAAVELKDREIALSEKHIEFISDCIRLKEETAGENIPNTEAMVEVAQKLNYE